MPTTKSGIETPTTPPKNLPTAPTKIYEGSKDVTSRIGKGLSIDSPCKTYKK